MGVCGGRGRFRKGSPEAKAYMARLRAMRKGNGIRGLGFPKGIKPRELRDAVRQARINGQFKVKVRNHTLDLTQARQEIDDYIKMQRFWKTHDHKQYHGKNTPESGKS